MKIQFAATLFFLSVSYHLYAQTGVAINTNGADPDNSAMLDVSSTSKGLLVPRMTFEQRNTITSPAKGLLVYQNDSIEGFYYFDGTIWTRLASGTFTESDPLVKAVNGLVKSNGTTISAATAGTDYLTPTGSAANLTNFPTLNQHTTGTASNVTGTISIEHGGTGQITKTAAFDALSPMTAAGDLIFCGTNGTGTRLAAGTAGQFLKMNAGATSPVWSSQSLTNFTESNYTYNSETGVRLLATHAANDVNLVLSPKGQGAIQAQASDGTSAGGNNRGIGAIDFQMNRANATQVASGTVSAIIGGERNTASSNDAFVGGGYGNTAGGARSAILGGTSNTTNGYNTFIGGGVGNTAPSYAETAFGSYATTYSAASIYSSIGTDRLFVVGNGTADASRSNALSILKNANTIIGGSLTINGNGTPFAFPTGRGTSGQCLITDGNGTTSWYTLPAYLTSYTETDPVWTTATANYYTKANMQTSGSAQLHFNNLTNKPNTVSGYGITDAMTTAHAANGITSTNISNWNTAYGWGSHTGLYRPISYVPSWSEITGNPFSISSPSNNQLLKYNSTTSKWENWTPNYLTSYTESDPVVKAVNGLVKANGSAISAAVSGTDYLAPGQAVTAVTGTGPIISSGGTTPAISISPATTLAAGSMSAADKTKLDGINGSETKLTAGTNVSITGSGTLASPYVVQSAQAPGTAAGQMQYWNGTTWVTIAPGTNGQILEFSNGVPTWVNKNLSNLSVGDSYQGGIIAYFLQSGDPGYDANVRHGIIAAPGDQSAGIQWYNGSYNYTMASYSSLGYGNSNTNTIVASQGAGSYAARLCYDLVLNGYSDWFLPSRDELSKLYQNRTAIGGFSNGSYWSSTEYNDDWAITYDFNSGIWNTIIKENTYYVRAIRSF